MYDLLTFEQWCLIHRCRHFHLAAVEIRNNCHRILRTFHHLSRAESNKKLYLFFFKSLNIDLFSFLIKLLPIQRRKITRKLKEYFIEKLKHCKIVAMLLQHCCNNAAIILQKKRVVHLHTANHSDFCVESFFYFFSNVMID